MVRQRKSGELLRQTLVHPLGRLTLAGLHIDDRATEPMPMRFWDTFAIVYVISGRAQFHDQSGLSLSMRRGDLLLTFPGHGYCYQIDEARSWSEFYLHFQGPIFDLWQQHKVLDATKPIYHLTTVEKWLQRFERLVRTNTARHTVDILKQTTQFLDLLSDVLAKGCGQSGNSPQSLWLSQASALLDNQPVDETVDWDGLAEEMGLSYDRFRKRFAELAGTTPAKYLAARRLEAACTMLQDRSLGLKEIARKCGFCDVFHFSKRFKQGFQMTPTEYRQYKLHDP